MEAPYYSGSFCSPPNETKPETERKLYTMTEAAKRLGCSKRTLKGHIESGALRYVSLGHGPKRKRRMNADRVQFDGK